MGREFKQFDGREFGQSPGRERNTESAQGYQGIHRVQSGNDARAAYYLDGSLNPVPPPGLPINEPDPDAQSEWIWPTPAYSNTFISSDIGDLGSGDIGGGFLETFAQLRPDLIPSYFRMRYRVWGLAHLVNPWIEPDFIDTWQGLEPISTPVRAYDYQPEIYMQWNHLLPVTQVVTGTQIRGMILNSVSTDDADLPAPFGLWSFDRIVTWYGIFNPTGGQARPNMIASRLPLQYPNGISKSFDFVRGLYRQDGFFWNEPNHTLANPVAPVTISNPLLPPGDNGTTVFGSALPPDQLWTRGFGVCAVLIEYVPVAAPGPITILDLVAPTQVSVLRPS